jgi:hypothetical protein
MVRICGAKHSEMNTCAKRDGGYPAQFFDVSSSPKSGFAGTSFLRESLQGV